MSMKKKKYEGDNPFNAEHETESAMTIERVDEALYGKLDLPSTGKKVSNPIALDKITPDPIQPRREIPTIVRNKARAAKMAEWQMWHQMSENALGKSIPLAQLLRGEGEAAENESEIPPLVKGFLELVKLASSIYREGLLYAITVVQRGDRYVIETGERRYQATTMLYGEFGEKKFSTIDARVVEKASVWAQAAENAARKPLNAIGTARQIALLLMELNKGRDGISYVRFEDMEGDCDRAFYAQVANGNVHRIPKGESERVLTATGLKSRSQIAHYRALLDIPDEIWTQADEEDWPEFKIREKVKPEDHTFTGVNVNGVSLAPNPRPARNDTVVKQMRYLGRSVGYIRLDEDGTARIQHYNPDGSPSYQQNVTPTELRDLPAPVDAAGPFQPRPQGIDYNALPTPPYAPPAVSYDAIGQGKASRIEVGQRRRNTILNRVFEVMSINNTTANCREIDRRGEPMRSGAFEIDLSKLLEMELVNKDDFSASPTPDTRLSGPDMPDGGWKPGMKVITFAGKKGTVLEVKGRDVYIETDDGDPIKCFEGNMRLRTTREIEKEQTEEALENPSSNKPDRPAWLVEGTSVETTSGKRGVIILAGWDEVMGTWMATVTNKFGDKDYRADNLIPLNAPVDEAPIDGQRPPMPDWAVIGAPVQNTKYGKRGTIDRFWWAMNNQWMAHVDDRENGFATALADLKPSDEYDLPDWAVAGATVAHKETGKICDVYGTGIDPKHDAWFLRVSIRGESGIHDVALHEFEPCTPSPIEEAPAAPRERHPALNPHNASGVITQEQYKLGSLWNMATDLKMQIEASQITRMKTLTANSVTSFLQQDGEEAAYARLEAMYNAGHGVLTVMYEALTTIHNEACEVLRQLAAEKPGA